MSSQQTQSWQPSDQAGFTDPLIRQLLAFIQRDQRAALDYYVGTEAKSIASYLLAAEALPQFPYVWLYDDESVFDQLAVGSRHYTARLYCEVAVSNQDYQRLAILRRQYARAVDAVLMTLQLSDFYSGWPLRLPILGPDPVTTVPIQPGAVKELWVARHRMGRMGKAGTGFAASALLEIHIEMEEI